MDLPIIIPPRSRHALCWSVGIAVLGMLFPFSAQAHFALQVPASWWTQDSQGNPQKEAPCGNEAFPGTMASPAVTPFTFAAGAARTINITVNETVPHPGHYRVAVAATQSALPLDPVVTPSASDECASAAVQNPPVLPILGDNLSVKTGNRTGVQMFSVTVPENVTCTNCVLQVIEFMSSHGAPCFYHHCANVTIPGGAMGGAGGRGGAGGNGGGAGRAGSNGNAGGGAGSTAMGGGGATGGRLGSAGATAMGGEPGTGGAAISSGGASGGTVTTGGAPGSGGAPASGGAPGSGGASGVDASTKDGPAAGGAAADTGGCACSVTDAANLSAGWLLALLVVGGGCTRRRRRRG